MLCPPPCVHMAAAMCVEVLKFWHVNCYALNRCSSVLFDRWHVSCQHVLEADTCDTCVTSQYKQGQPCVTHDSLIRLSVTITRMRCHFTCLSWRVREFKVSRWHFHAWYELCVSSFSFLTSWAPVNSGLGLAGLTEQSSPLLSSSRGHEWLRRTGWLIKGDIQSFHVSLLCFQAMMQWGILDHSLKVWR